MLAFHNNPLRFSCIIQHIFADARSGKSHTIGEELILPAVREVLYTVVHKSPDQVIKAIPLSDNSVQRRVDEMAENIEETLCNILMTTELACS